MLEPQKNIGKGMKIRFPFRVSAAKPVEHHTLSLPHNRPRRETQQPATPQQPNFTAAFANTFAPMIGKLPVRMLPNYKEFTEAGIEITKNVVEQSGVGKYLSFEPFKNYFSITHRYVLRKLLLIVAPYSDSVQFSLDEHV